MKSMLAKISLAYLVGLLLTLPAVGQIANGIVFETKFPFYAGNAKMPPGKYTVTQPGQLGAVLLIEGSDGSHTAYIDYVPANGESPHPSSDVTFNKYGDTDFLNLIWIQGSNSGLQVLPSKVEENLAKSGAATKHSVPVKSGS